MIFFWKLWETLAMSSKKHQEENIQDDDTLIYSRNNKKIVTVLREDRSQQSSLLKPSLQIRFASGNKEWSLVIFLIFAKIL